MIVYEYQFHGSFDPDVENMALLTDSRIFVIPGDKD